jgi:hypothetical protein
MQKSGQIIHLLPDLQNREREDTEKSSHVSVSRDWKRPCFKNNIKGLERRDEYIETALG